MSERRENSVLFSLKELRNIEDGRVRKEKEEAEARVEADRAAKAAAERAVREAEERRIREEEDRVRQIEEQKLSREREDQMRLQEAERRARVEGEVRLHEERMRLEVQAKHQQKSPLKAILGVAGVLVIIGGGLGYKMYSDHQAEIQAERQKVMQAEEAARAAKAESDAKLAALQKDFDQQIKNATSEADKARLRLQLEQKKAELAGHSGGGHKAAAKADDKPATAKDVRKIGKKDISNNPLDGLDLK